MPEMQHFLEKMRLSRRLQIEELKAIRPLELIMREISNDDPHAFSRALGKEGIRIIAELKKASPSKGILQKDFNVSGIALSYKLGGAAALSVLTEPSYFHGRFEYLGLAREGSGLPILCKDFVIDPYQISYARAMKADAILLICRMLTNTQLKDWIALSHSLSMDVLVETHSETECERALDAGAKIVGVNARDLDTFVIDRELPAKLRAMIPDHVIAVAESGVRDASDISILSQQGYRHFLIGESLMKTDNPTTLLQSMLRV
jgi:indole-3-glycerol phosphate synthase